MADFIDQNLGKRRAEIRRGLSRSNTAAIGISILVIVLASLAVRHAFHADSVARKSQLHEREAVQASKRAETELWNSLQAQGRANRLTGIAGRRTNALQAIAAAAAIRPSDSLRHEAIASLALTDVGPAVFEKKLGRFRISPQHGVKLKRTVFLESERKLLVYRLPEWEVEGEIPVDRPPVMGLRIDPRERFVGLQSRDGRVQIWDVDRDGEGAREPELYWETKAPLFSFERNGDELFTCLSNGEVQRLDLASRRQEEVVRLDPVPLEIVLDDAAKRLAARYANRVEIWELDSKQKINELETSDQIRPLKWHPDGRHLAIGLMNAEVWLWDTTTNQTRVLSGHTSAIDVLAFDPFGDLLLSASWDSSTRFWDAQSGEFLFATREAYARRFSEDGRHVTWQREQDTVGIWEVIRSPVLRRIHMPGSQPRTLGGVAFWQDSRHLALTDARSLQVWDAQKSVMLFEEPMQVSASVLFRPEMKSMFASSQVGLFRWPVSQDAASGITVGKQEILVRPQRGGFFERCALSPDGKFLAVVGGTEALVLNLGDPAKPLRLKKTPSALVQVAVGPEARWVAAGTWKGWGMGVWNGQSGELLRKLSDENCAMNFSRDGSMLAVSTPSGYSIYETTNWNVRFHVPSQVAGVVPGAINFNRDGTLLAVSPGIPPIHLVDPHSGRLLGKLTPPNIKNVSWIDFSPDGTQLAAATDHSNVDIWDLQALGKELAALNLGWDVGATNVLQSTPLVASAVGGPSSPILSRGRVIVPMVGVGLALLLAAITIRFHRKWLGIYDQVEDLAAQRQRELVRTQGELMQSQKMQALGTLAAGIAHDFNNLLSVIRLSNDFLKRGVKADPNLAEETEAIARAVHQGKSVVNSMLGYTRSQPDDRASVNICEVVEELVAMLSHQFLAGIQLTVDLDKEAPLVEVPRSALQQVLLNLVVNACEAMKFRGKLRISVTVAESAPASGLVKSPRPGSHYAVLTVADNGPGMNADIQSQIFEPFFTTKQIGASPGRGLGLSTVYMIAEQEGLGLGLESATQQGAVFQIFIPAPAPQ